MSLCTGFILRKKVAGTSRRFRLLFIVVTLINIQECEFVRHIWKKQFVSYLQDYKLNKEKTRHERYRI